MSFEGLFGLIMAFQNIMFNKFSLQWYFPNISFIRVFGRQQDRLGHSEGGTNWRWC